MSVVMLEGIAVGTAPLSSPLSRRDDATVVPAPCQSCGVRVLHFGWVNLDGVGVLYHDDVDGSEPCPAAVPFDWATGKRLALVDGGLA